MAGARAGGTLVLALLPLLLLLPPLAPAAAAAAAVGGAAPRIQRQLRVMTVDVADGSPRHVSFNWSLKRRSRDVDSAKQHAGCAVPEQVRLTYWNASAVLVSWATCEGVVADQPPPVRHLAAVADGSGADAAATPSSSVWFAVLPDPNAAPAARPPGRTATGVATSYVADYSSRQLPSYASPLLHHVLLTGLVPGQAYEYRIIGGTPEAAAAGLYSAQRYAFTMPAASFPFHLGVLADPGQSLNTSVVLEQLAARSPDLLAILGDLSYADDWRDGATKLPDELQGDYSFQPKWDSWARLFEPLLSRVPFVHTPGNHEIEALPGGAWYTAYNARFPVAQPGGAAPSRFGPASSSPGARYANLYHAVDVPGVFRLLLVTPYAPGGRPHDAGDEQYAWLKQQLAQTDRDLFPWLLVGAHAPFYSSSASHFKQAECMRQAYEPLLLEGRVDAFLSGHVHSYERSRPLADHKRSDCGPVHLVVGTGGNTEGLSTHYIDELVGSKGHKPRWCDEPSKGYQFPSYVPQHCLSWQADAYCFDRQPDWSAFREPSFGAGALTFINATHARWAWHRAQDSHPAPPADEVMLLRGAANTRCSGGGGGKRSAGSSSASATATAVAGSSPISNGTAGGTSSSSVSSSGGGNRVADKRSPPPRQQPGQSQAGRRRA